MTPNQKAFLSMLAWSEGTSTSPATVCDGYDVIVTGADGKPEVFTDFSTHPFTHRMPKVINSHGLLSTASGRYQFLIRDWVHYKSVLKLSNFNAWAQDAWAIQIIRECNALPDIDAGDINSAIARVAHLWASLPGADYGGQNMRKIGDLLDQFTKYGGVLSA